MAGLSDSRPLQGAAVFFFCYLAVHRGRWKLLPLVCFYFFKCLSFVE